MIARRLPAVASAKAGLPAPNELRLASRARQTGRKRASGFMERLQQLFEIFLRERTYIQNVTPKTLDWSR